MAAKKKRPNAKPKRKPVRRDPLRATPPRAFPRDTPVETRAVTLIEPAAPVGVVDTSSALATRPETIEAAYDAWDELRAELRTVKASFASERERLEQQGALLLGAVQTVLPAAGGEGLAKRSELNALAAEAKRGLKAAQDDLEARAKQAEAALNEAVAHVVSELRARVARQAELAKPSLELMVRVLPNDQRILHLRRPSPDAAVTLLFVTSGRVPTRYGALFDDSTEEATLAPPVLYADEGVRDVRLKAPELQKLLEERPTLWPIKGMLPMLTPFGFLRWLERGPVMEAELADGDGFRNLLTKTEAEQITGALLALKLEGRIELELVRG
ncbi:MAG: hypothetical protein GQE15_39080 [Archangiaceae bacterium]|nr:hypothetical protein [Archangiaceae bacterium]